MPGADLGEPTHLGREVQGGLSQQHAARPQNAERATFSLGRSADGTGTGGRGDAAGVVSHHRASTLCQAHDRRRRRRRPLTRRPRPSHRRHRRRHPSARLRRPSLPSLPLQHLTLWGEQGDTRSCGLDEVTSWVERGRQADDLGTSKRTGAFTLVWFAATGGLTRDVFFGL